ncbi:MAG TPA: TRAG family protein [Planctomycetaceae bacterium]|nr:TRAG family protein [Planctomycetaceae bacterium]
MRTDRTRRQNLRRAALQENLLADLPRGRNADHIGVPPHSHFEPIKNLLATESLQFEASKNLDAKRFLGVLNGVVVEGARLSDGRTTRYVHRGVPIGVGDDRHCVLLAGSRAGKGRNILIPAQILASRDTSLFSLDPKGTSAYLTARYRAEVLNQRVVVFDPMEICGTHTRRYRASLNPIDLMLRKEPRRLVFTAQIVAEASIISGESRDRHWDDCSRDFVAGILVHVATHERYAKNRDLVTVWHLISEATAPDPNDPARAWLETEMLANESFGGFVRTAARNFYGRTGGEFSSVLSNLRKHTNWFGYESLKPCLIGKTVDPCELKSSSAAWYVAVEAMQMANFRGWLRMMVQLALAAHEEEPKQHGPNTQFLLDEYHVLGTLSCVESAAGLMAGLGVSLHTVLQDLAQLQASHSKTWETFIANSGVVQAFGIADHTTAEYLSKRLGQAQTLSRSTTSPTFDQATRDAASGENWSVSVHPLMTPDEIIRYFGRNDPLQRSLVLRPGYRPMICQRVCYDQHEIFEGRYYAGE